MKRIMVYFVAVIFATTLFSCGGSGETTDNNEEKDTVETKVDTKLTDKRDGHVYETVVIGEQTWMAENLVFETDSGWYAYADDKSNIVKYGRLYNWKTAMQICPDGWHLPSMEEWTALVDFLGGKDVAGGKLKSTSNLWEQPNEGADNSSGFSMLPTGSRKGWGDFAYEDIGVATYFWSSSPNSDDSSNILRFWGDSESADLTAYGDNNNAYPVRCLKD